MAPVQPLLTTATDSLTYTHTHFLAESVYTLAFAIFNPQDGIFALRVMRSPDLSDLQLFYRDHSTFV